ncbi:MAG: phage scaffolding protein [Nocardioides sp.]
MDLLTPAGSLDIEALLALHRSTFGSARMEADDEDQHDETDDTSDDDGTDDQSDGDGDGGDEGADQLGDAGKKALDRQKARANAERDRRKALEAELAELRAKNAGGDPNDLEAARKAARDEGRSEALTKANQRILRSEVRAAAAGKLNDPADALKLLDLSKFEVDDDGNVDEDEIADAIADLVKAKPYLAAQGGKRFQGGADGGARKESRPTQLTQDDLDRMTPEQIVKAKADGRFADLLAGKKR